MNIACLESIISFYQLRSQWPYVWSNLFSASLQWHDKPWFGAVQNTEHMACSLCWELDDPDFKWCLSAAGTRVSNSTQLSLKLFSSIFMGFKLGLLRNLKFMEVMDLENIHDQKEKNKNLA